MYSEPLTANADQSPQYTGYNQTQSECHYTECNTQYQWANYPFFKPIHANRSVSVLFTSS